VRPLRSVLVAGRRGRDRRQHLPPGRCAGADDFLDHRRRRFRLSDPDRVTGRGAHQRSSPPGRTVDGGAAVGFAVCRQCRRHHAPRRRELRSLAGNCVVRRRRRREPVRAVAVVAERFGCSARSRGPRRARHRDGRRSEHRRDHLLQRRRDRRRRWHQPVGPARARRLGAHPAGARRRARFRCADLLRIASEDRAAGDAHGRYHRLPRHPRRLQWLLLRDAEVGLCHRPGHPRHRNPEPSHPLKTMHNVSAGDRALAIALFIVAAITAAYWILWYLVPAGEAMLSVLPGDAAHKRFEDAFLAADTWMAIAAVIAALRLLSGSPGASAWLYMAGSAAIYLAGMDILYDVQNGIYALAAMPEHRDAVVTEAVINLGTLVFAGLSIGRARKASACRPTH